MIAFLLASCVRSPDTSTTPTSEDGDGDGYGPTDNDCDDADPSRHPGAEEVVGDAVDQDCDGSDQPTVSLVQAARWRMVGDAEFDRFGTAVACTASSVGSLGSVVAIGADQSGASLLESSSKGYAVLVEGSMPASDAQLTTSEVAWRVDGSQKLDELGFRVAFPGDLDGDGDGELVVTANTAYRPDPHTGAAFVFDPVAGEHLVPEQASVWVAGTWLQNASGTLPVGDLDEDGVAELLVAESGNQDWETPGRIFVHRGTDLRKKTTADDAWLTIDAIEPHSATGRYLGMGDLTGDGEPDLVLGEYDAEPDGQLAVLPGPASTWRADEGWVLRGSGNDQNFGRAISVADLDGDGLDDLVVGAHGSSSIGERRGSAYVFLGPITEALDSSQAAIHLHGETDFAWMGARTVTGDFDGDGATDLVVAAPSDWYFSYQRPGLLYLFLGPLTPGELRAEDAAVIWRGAEGGEQLGWALAACDLDGDGDDELVIGAPGTAMGEELRGRVYVVDGGPR
ncbi:MAG: FG-GAP repeat protein [Alphaproteobacteria bacterium]|nr:FG-GAP repeat protein [Alphaproteobacteria bacterium]